MMKPGGLGANAHTLLFKKESIILLVQLKNVVTNTSFLVVAKFVLEVLLVTDLIDKNVKFIQPKWVVVAPVGLSLVTRKRMSARD